MQTHVPPWKGKMEKYVIPMWKVEKQHSKRRCCCDKVRWKGFAPPVKFSVGTPGNNQFIRPPLDKLLQETTVVTPQLINLIK